MGRKKQNNLEILETSGNALGNTITTGVSNQPLQRMHWCFTFNNHTDADIEILETIFTSICVKYCFQEERGQQGTHHLQGVISLKKRARWTEFGLPKQIHWEPCNNITASYTYCSKLETRVGRIFTLNYKIPKPLQIINRCLFKTWQIELVNILEQPPDDRTVYWIWSQEGNLGKSSFAKWLVYHMKATPAVSGKYADIINLIFKANMDECNIIVFDIPRNNGNHVSYSAIESIKNGMIVNTKFETGYKLFNPPHVVVLANEPPEICMLSRDRWKIKEIFHHI